MSTESKVILGVTAAALAGVGIGMLVAPCSGAESRGKIRENVNTLANHLLEVVRSNGSTFGEQAEEITDAAKAKFNEAKGYLKSEAGHAKGRMEEIVDTVKAKFNEVKGYAKSEAEHAKNGVHEMA